MAYQNPAFMVAHPASALPTSAIGTLLAGTSLSTDSKRALIDSRQGEEASFIATAANAGITYLFDGFPLPRVNRVVVPAGHTFDGFNLHVISDDDFPGFPSPGAPKANFTQSGSGIIDVGFSLITTDINWLFRAADSAADDVFILHELWLGERKALTTNDARVAPGFERPYEHDVSEDEFGGRTAALELAPARRKFSLRVAGLDPAESDFATLDEVIRDGRSKPFWYWTPDSTDTGPYLVKLTDSATRKQSSPVPLNSIRYEVQLEMLEQLT